MSISASCLYSQKTSLLIVDSDSNQPTVVACITISDTNQDCMDETGVSNLSQSIQQLVIVEANFIGYTAQSLGLQKFLELV